MNGEIALDTSVAVRFLNGNTLVTERVLALPEIILSMVVVGELLFGAENSTRPLQNLPRYLDFIAACVVAPLARETAAASSCHFHHLLGCHRLPNGIRHAQAVKTRLWSHVQRLMGCQVSNHHRCIFHKQPSTCTHC